jgi:hypothetical protein
LTNPQWTDADTIAKRLDAELQADPDIFVLAVADANARNPFDGL